MPENRFRPWGEYSVIEKTKIITLKPNKRLSLQYHNNREEAWTILEGTGKVTIDSETFEAKTGDKFLISYGAVHRVESYENGLKFLEVATGEVDEDDIIRLEDDYGRIENKE